MVGKKGQGGFNNRRTHGRTKNLPLYDVGDIREEKNIIYGMVRVVKSIHVECVC